MKRLFILLLTLVISPSFALILSPNTHTFSPEENNITNRFLITNNSDEILPIELYVVSRDIQSNGDPIYGEEPLEDEFIIFPEQLLLAPNEKQSVQLSWVSDTPPKSEKSFALMTEVLPVPTSTELGEGDTSLNLSVRYSSAIYVEPAEAKPVLAVKASSIKGEANGEEQEGLLVVVKNTGSGRARLYKPSLKITQTHQGRKKETILQKDQLTPIDRTTVLAGSERHYILPWPKELPKEEIQKVQLNYSKEPSGL